ncbi:DUF6583 family protein [Pontibacillus halophilus]|nr:DUF6583 family protein [Pontibacillus halophilus]
MKTWIIVLVTVLIVGGGGATAFGLLLNNSPMAVYTEAQINTLEDQEERMEDYNKNARSIAERTLEEDYGVDGSLSMNVNAKGGEAAQSPNLMLVKSILSGIELNYEQKTKYETKEIYGGFDLQMQGQSLGSANFYQDETNTSFQAPFLYDQYLTFENDRFKELIERTGESAEGMETFPNFVDSMQASLEPEEANEILKDYVETIAEQLGEDQFSMEDGVEFEGESYKKVTLDVSEEKSQELITAVLEQLKEDERVKEILETQANLNGLPSEEIQFATSVQEAIDNVDQIKLPEGIKMEAYIKDEIIEHQLLMMTIGDEESQGEISMQFDYLPDGEERYEKALTLDVTSQPDEASFQLNYSETGNASGEDLKVDYTFGTTIEDSTMEQPVKLEGTANAVYRENSVEAQFNVDLGELSGQAAVASPQFSGTYKQETTEEDDTFKQDIELGIEAGIEDPTLGNQNFEVTFNVNQDVAFGGDLSFPDTEGAVNLADATDEELQQLAQEIEMNFQSHVGQFMGGFGGF